MKKWLLLAVVGLLSACTKSGVEELNVAPNAGAPTFYASLEGGDETRTYLDANQKMRWTADDRVTIFFGENYNREFAFTGETGSTAGSFNQKSTDGFYTAEKVTANYAVYPHQASTQLEVEGYFKLSLPATQSYAEDSFGLNANTMVAVTKTVDDRFLQFKNVCGYLKLNLYGAKVTVKSITFAGNNDEPLAGAATVTPTYGGDPSMAWAASGTTTSLTLDCGDGVKIGATEAEATPFWLVVPPTTFTKGFTVTITDTAGNTFTKSSSSQQTITRNVSKNMPAFEVRPVYVAPAANEIWYTSTDGNIVTPFESNIFGATIVSNTYENGKGIITFDGNVTKIAECVFSWCESLASVTLPVGVTTIGEYAFAGCTSLASVTLPEGLTTIGMYAFYNCKSLTSITLPEGLTTIGETAFYDCTSLASITIPEGVTEIGRYAFQGCTSLASVTIPEGVTTIGQYTFSGCTSLASVTLPESLTRIERYAFEACESLKRVDISDISAWCQINFVYSDSNPMSNGASLYLNGTLVEHLIIPEGVTTIGKYTFSGCTSLASVTIPEGVTTIGEEAFGGCTSLASITLPEGVTTIGEYAFCYCTSLASITLPEGVTTIGDYAFCYCTSLAKFEGPLATSDQRCIVIDGTLVGFAPAGLTEYAVPEGVTSIGNYAFSYCTSLASITIPEGVTTIGFCAFQECTSLASITLPEGVTTIGEYAFCYCTSLASITLPAGLTTIGSSAFYNCTSLASVCCKPATPPTGGPSMFAGNASDRKIYVPAGSVDAYKAAAYWSNYAADIVEEAEPTPAANEIWYTSTDGNIVTPYSTSAFGVAIKSNTYTDGKGVITFEGNVTTIGKQAFYNCTSLASVTLPEGVTTIGDWAFHGCTSLASITLPEGVTTIGHHAFENCTSLASITLPEGVTTIGDEAFQSCSSLASITIPEGVMTIGQYTFSSCI